MEEEKVTSEYFQSISDLLLNIQKEAPWADQVLGQLRLLKMDVRFLKVFCLCLGTKDTTDEESNERWRSMITPLTVIWTKELKGLSFIERVYKSETWPSWPIDVSLQDFHPAMFELEAKIQQSKQHVEGLCENLMHSSMQCKSSTFFDIWYFLQHIRKNLNRFSSFGAANIVLLKKRIDILKTKIVFLKEPWKGLEGCPYTKENLQFLNFICAFANKAACLTCLYWAKEAHDEMGTEMNIAVFEMLQKFIPLASDITPLYIGILKAYDLLPSDSFLIGEAVESSVDFFFEHLTTTLNEDFLILRDGLIFLFTFLTDSPCENAEEEESIRSHIYALFHVDAYLLLPFAEMQDDFSDKKMLLSDCMIKIDTANGKIRQLNCGFVDSCLSMEVKKMEYILFVSVHRELSWIEKHAKWAEPLQGQLQLHRMKLRFLRMFLLCFTTWDDADEEIRVRLNSMITSLQGIWVKEEGKGLLTHRLHTIRTGGITDWHALASELEGKIQLSELEFEAWCVKFFHLSLRCKPSTTYKTLKFLDSILDNLNDLVNYKAGEIVPFKKQIETLKVKLIFLKNFLKLTTNCIDHKGLGEFNMFVQVFINDAACLTFLYWAKDANDEIAYETNSMLFHMLQKIKPATPDVARLYFETLEAIYVQRSDSLMFGQTAFSFVDLFLEDQVTLSKDDILILQDDIVFLLTFLNNPPNENAKELICSKIDVLFWEGLYNLLPFDDMQGDDSKKKVLLSDFMMRIENVNANIRRLYCEFPDSSLYNFPKVISPRFLDFLIQNLRSLEEWMVSDQKYAPFAKYKIMKIEEELVSLRPFFNHIFDLQSELNETWLEVVNSIHLMEHVISLWISSLVVFDKPIWYHMAYLSDVFDGIKVVKTKLQKIKEKNVYNDRCLPRSTDFISTPPEQVRHSKSNEIVVGFEDEAESIIGKLTRGHMPLDTVSIVGMGGSGKTTLAYKVYGSSTVKCNFDVFAFCTVSQEHDTRRLLLDILRDIEGVGGGVSDMTDDDLAHLLWKCLSRQKYLIVLDDIWNASVWNKVKSSFPDDKNGSKVMFTTRSNEVAEKCKISCSPHQLRFLSEVESWELLQKKVFHDGISPPHLDEIGKLIAKNCKGLPLAVAVISGLLDRTEKNPRWWSEVAERVVSYLSDEGCMNVLELSYKHLPENLKPCLLYLGAFPEDTLIRVKKVKLLWIAEGFVYESKTKSLQDVAKEYFQDLVDRSLIIVGARSSDGEIKMFRIHDLIHDLCQTKCRDGNLFLLNHGTASSSSSDPSANNHYRVSTQKQIDITTDDESSLSYPRSLLYFCVPTDDKYCDFLLRKFRHAQVLDLDLQWQQYNIDELSSLVHLRHLHTGLLEPNSIPSSISNLWNLGSLTLTALNDDIHLPETFWRMKSLRHVKVSNCILKFSDCDKHEAYPKLDKLVSFSRPIISTGKDLQWLLQRLPAIRRLFCWLKGSREYDEEPNVETLDFDDSKLESLKLCRRGGRSTSYLINFPSTLKILTLVWFELPLTAVSAIAELHCLEVLKLKCNSFTEKRLDIEDMTFQKLKFFELYDRNLVEWNACTESLPCLEQLVIECSTLEDLPPCFGEISTLKRIVVKPCCSQVIQTSALRIKEELIELGNEVEVSIYKR